MPWICSIFSESLVLHCSRGVCTHLPFSKMSMVPWFSFPRCNMLWEKEYLGWWSKTQVFTPPYHKMDVWFKKIRNLKIRKQSSSFYLICLFIILAWIHWFIPSVSLLILTGCLLNIRHWVTLKHKVKNKSRPWVHFRNYNL